MTIQQATSAPGQLAVAGRAAEAEALTAAGAFGSALRASAESLALARAHERLASDADAQAAIATFERRQQELRVPIMFGTLDPSQRAELEGLQAAMLAGPAVAGYIAGQDAFQAVCRETAAVISSQIGLDFAANCSSGSCCG